MTGAAAFATLPVLGAQTTQATQATQATQGAQTTAMTEPNQLPSGNTFTIDDLAAVARVPSRTIRFYQAKGLLPKPEMRGRVAYYGSAHADRLKLVAELQDRGLQIKAICELVERIDKGEVSVQEWLGLEDQLKEPWAQDQPRVVDGAELQAMIGESRPGRTADLVRAGLLERKGDAFLVQSPALLSLAVKLEAVGVDFHTVVGAEKILRKQMARTAHDLAEHFLASGDSMDGRSKGHSFGEVGAVLRPVALDAIKLVFAQEMERVLRGLVDSGRTTKIARRGRPNPSTSSG